MFSPCVFACDSLSSGLSNTMTSMFHFPPVRRQHDLVQQNDTGLEVNKPVYYLVIANLFANFINSSLITFSFLKNW